MRNIIKDITENCPECHCDTEKTVQFMAKRGDLKWTSEHYREVWFFFLRTIDAHGYNEGRKITLEVMQVKKDKWKTILKWARRVGLR